MAPFPTLVRLVVGRAVVGMRAVACDVTGPVKIAASLGSAANNFSFYCTVFNHRTGVFKVESQESACMIPFLYHALEISQSRFYAQFSLNLLSPILNHMFKPNS
jgi:hypothetical protein